MSAWKPPLIIAAVAVSIVAGFYLGGPGLGMAVGALAASAIVIVAVRKPPLHPIVPPLPADRRRHVLVVLGGPLGGAAVGALARAIEAGGEDDLEEPDVLVVALSRNRFLERWTSDLDPGRDQAQRELVLGLASLATAGVRARARVGDESLAQTVEDELRSFPATEVILVGERDGAASSLAPRLRAPLRQLVLAGTEPAERALSGSA